MELGQKFHRNRILSLLTKLRVRGSQKIFARLTPWAVRFFRMLEKPLGPPFVLIVAGCITATQVLLRSDEWRYFGRLYARLPVRLRSRASARRAYWRMLWLWYSGICVAFLQDRVGDRRWARRLSVRGIDPASLREPDQPVIFAFLHVGVAMTGTPWLRSFGIPVTSYIAANLPFMSEDFLRISARGDARYNVRATPLSIAGKGRRPWLVLSRALKNGAVLAMALDSSIDNPQLKVPAAGGLITLQDGPIRLAMSRKALLIPTSFIEEGPLRYAIVFGQPVAAPVMESGDIQAAASHIINELMPIVENNPGCMTWTTMEALCPEAKARRRLWP